MGCKAIGVALPVDPTMKCILALLCALLIFTTAHAVGSPPQSVAELWAGYDPRKEPLEVEVLKEWEEDGVVCRIVRYQVGVFKGAPSRVAGFYAFPKGGTKLPALVEIHGGGQSASLSSVVKYAKRGYAGISINWGGNKMSMGNEMWGGPQTDWGKLDATHPPQRNKANHFAGPLTPDEFTLDAVESPLNSNWFLVLMAARRAITFLETQAEVDATRIGAHGHSMGGKLTTNLAGIDKRVRAAVPSCGGSGDLVEGESTLPGGSKTKRNAMELACISDNAYLPLITCPVLWLSPTNDFHAHIDNMAWNWRDLPDDRTRFSISPHFNHRHTEEHAITEYLWFEEHLKGADFKMPRTPQIALDLKAAGGVPQVTVTVDDSRPVQRVDIYYSIDPHGLTRFWRDAHAMKAGKQWQAQCPVMSPTQPIFVFANVAYETPSPYQGPQGTEPGRAATFAISSRVLSAGHSQLQAAQVKATDKPERMVDDGTRGWHDWYLMNWGHAPLWTASTRKLRDAKWRGPDGAKLQFEIQCETDNQLVITFNTNGWGAVVPGKPTVDYVVVKPLKGAEEWQTITVELGELVSTNAKVTAPLASWQTVTEFSISPSGTMMKDGKKEKVNGNAWKGGRAIRRMQWIGGDYPRQMAADAPLSSEAHKNYFNEAIRKSLEHEKLDRK